MSSDFLEHKEWLGWTVCGIAGIIAIYLIANLIYKNSVESSRRDRAVKTAKIEACKTISDQGTRALYIILGGAGQ